MSKLNPKLKKGDRIVLVYMDGETLGPGTKGEVLEIGNAPKFSTKDLGYMYNVQWFDEDGNPLSKLSLLPETDAWIYDKDSNIKNIQEIDFRNLDDLISKGDFLAVFSKKELEEVFNKDFEIAVQSANKLVRNFNIDDDAFGVVVEMCFQLGINRVSKFVKFLDALKNQDYARAANEMLLSKWHEQTPERCQELSNIIRSCK